MSRFGNPDFSWLKSVDDIYATCRSLLSEGKSFYAIHKQLAESGVDDDHIDSVLNDLTIEAIEGWIAEGLSEPQIVDRLVSHGLTADEARVEIEKTLQKQARRDQTSRRNNLDEWRYYAGFGLIVVVAFLWGGNSLGFFRTVPGLGYFTMLLGASLAGYQYFHEPH